MHRTRLVLAALASTLALTGAVSTPAAADGPEWRWPVRGEVVERFDVGKNPYAPGQHRGVDVAAARGARVRAACAGRVRFAGRAGTFGRAVSVACGRYVVSYGHLAVVSVEGGQAVSAGDPLGAVGTTGRPSSPGPHLHLGVRRAGERHGYVDPLGLLPRRGPAPGPPPLAPLTRRPRPIAAPPSRPRPLPAPPGRPRPLSQPAGRPGTAGAPAVGPPVAVWIGLALLVAGAPGLALLSDRRAPARRRRVRQRVAFHNSPR